MDQWQRARSTATAADPAGRVRHSVRSSDRPPNTFKKALGPEICDAITLIREVLTPSALLDVIDEVELLA